MNRLLLPLTLAVVLAVPATASATIVVNVGIAGVKPGQSQAKVRSILGKPGSTSRGRNEFGNVTTFFYNVRKLEVSFQGNANVTNISTRSPDERTAGGLGVGSTLARVRAAFKTEKCFKSSSAVGLCLIGGNRIGQKGTTFRFVKNKVNDVSIGIVID